MKELEEAIASQRAESKKTLDAAKDTAAVRERGFAERLAGLARDVGGSQLSSCMLRVYPVGYYVLIFSLSGICCRGDWYANTY